MSKRIEGTTDYHVVSITLNGEHDVTVESTESSLRRVRDEAIDTLEKVNKKTVSVEETDEMGRSHLDFEIR